MPATIGSGVRDSGERRGPDRRVAQVPFEGADRRKGERRSGNDRRAAPRTSAQ